MPMLAWIAVSVSVAIAAAVALRLRARRTSAPDHGGVSEHWVAEHRAGQQEDRHR